MLHYWCWRNPLEVSFLSLLVTLNDPVFAITHNPSLARWHTASATYGARRGDVERHPGFIEVAAHKAKTATRRIVPISENLSRWLAIAPRKENVRVWSHSKAWFFEALRDAAKDAKIKWKQNALRHSFISYRLAELQDVNRVALEAGNSPQMIFRHYRELATPEQAKTWFAIVPGTADKVVPIRTARARS